MVVKYRRKDLPVLSLPIIVIDSVFKLGKKLLPTAISSRMQVQHKREKDKHITYSSTQE